MSIGYYLFILGVVVGAVIGQIAFRICSGKGVLRIDHSNPDKDVYRFEINKLDDLTNKKRIILIIDHNANLS